MEDEFWHPKPEADCPPNTYRVTLDHPVHSEGQVSVALTQEHRFALWYWAECPNTVQPDLFSLDWHLDLADPEVEAKQAFQNYDQLSKADFTWIIWRKMSPYNDSHLLTAAWLGIINDVWLVYKQRFRGPDQIVDRNGKRHRINKFHSLAEALKHYRSHHNNRKVILDMDLDYFTNSPEFIGGGDQVDRMSDAEIARIAGPHAMLPKTLFPDLIGLTIATEPLFCGGIKMMTHILHQVDDLLFSPSLLHHGSRWRKYFANP